VAHFPIVETTLERIVGGGQALGLYPDGRKFFVWGGLPGEKVTAQVTKKRSKLIEGRVTEVLKPSAERVEPRDPASFLSTSPWQIMTAEAESHYKAALIEEAFELHDIVLPQPIDVKTDGIRYGYRNKVEFSFYWDNDHEQLELAFFVRASKGKVPVDGTSLAHENINSLARAVRDLLRDKPIEARQLKTLLIRCDQTGRCVWQLYVKDRLPGIISEPEATGLPATGGQVIYSDPKSPASKVTEVLASFGRIILSDSIMGIGFSYATEGFFQVNIPMYEQALDDMRGWLPSGPVVDMYSGVGTIGLTIGGDNATLVELDSSAVRDMKRTNKQHGSSANAIHAAAESALEHITSDATIIVDPPRAGLHSDVIARLLEQAPERIIYLSCNPVTQARDAALLASTYGIRAHTGYNFFPATPHIEHLVVLDKRA
jgi:23S rRNA (uracil1939-C5)-methyltransferase